MTKEKRKIKYLLVSLLLIVVCCAIGVTGAYFKFSKSFLSSGDLPILRVTGSVSSSNNFVNISNDGIISMQYTSGDVDLNVKISTEGNNIKGYVRVFVLVSWENSLSNVQDGEKVCDFVYNSDIWEIKDKGTGKYYYLKTGFLQPNEDVQLFSQIKFNENFSDIYYSKSVNIVVVPEIHQTTNLPTNW